MRKKIVFVALATLFVASCGVTRKAVAPEIVKVPSQEEADSIMNLSRAAVFVVEKASGPVIYALQPHTDSALVAIHCRTLSNKVWTGKPVVSYPCGEEFNLPLTSGPDEVFVRTFGGARFLCCTSQREKGGRIQKTVAMYQLDSDEFYSVSFDGKRRSDGKYYGQTNLSLQDNNSLPQKVWADSVLRRTPGFAVLSKEQLMSDQAIEWWLEKNPTAITKATKIFYGSLPPECTLVQQYQKAQKETSQAYRAALFDTLEYTVIVGQNRSTGAYSLIWVEPKCKNSKTDRLLNSIYFSNGSRLALFYYKGSRTFKYNLSLANGQLQR